MLEINDEVNVNNLEHMLNRLESDDCIDLFPYIPDDAVQSETVQIRSCAFVFVSYKFLPFILDKNLPPQDAFIILYNAIKLTDIVPQHTHLLDLLRVTCTFPEGRNIPVITRHKPGIPTILNTQLICWMKTKVLYQDFLDLSPQAVPVSSESDVAIKDAITGITNFQFRT